MCITGRRLTWLKSESVICPCTPRPSELILSMFIDTFYSLSGELDHRKQLLLYWPVTCSFLSTTWNVNVNLSLKHIAERSTYPPQHSHLSFLLWVLSRKYIYKKRGCSLFLSLCSIPGCPKALPRSRPEGIESQQRGDESTSTAAAGVAATIAKP